jgi:ankyrin repeat protein
LWQRHEQSIDFIKTLSGEQRVQDGNTLLHIAMLMDEPEYLANKIQCISNLIYAGQADLIVKNASGDTPLHNWAMCVHVDQHEAEEVDRVLHMRAKALHAIVDELVNSNNSTPLHIVCSRGLVNFLKFKILAELGIPLDTQNRQARTILHNLADSGADLNGQKAQILGYLRKNHDLSELLNVRDFEGRTALHIAIKNADKQVFDFLMRFRELNFNAVDNNGDTPLHYAAKNLNNSRLCGGYFITWLLRKNGLRRNVVNFEGKRAYKYVPDRFDRIKDRLKF